jgi:monovalent cation:H+ antiporter-2, CPA2 family
MEESFLKALVVAFLAASFIAAMMHRLRQSLLIGYLLAGMLIGPSGAGLIKQSALVQELAEVGVIMLMFTLGVEFSVAQLRRLKKPALLGGSIQLWGTLIIVTLFSKYWFGDWYGGFFAGCVIAMSSTVIVMKLLEDSGGSRTPQGSASLAISIYQDVMVVPMMLLLAAFAGRQQDVASNLFESIAKSVVFLGVSWVGARLIASRYLDVVAQTRSKELFTISAVALCLGIALLAKYLGLSLALGAFVAGLMVSSSIYSHKILSDVLPFRDCFLSLFFISVGMLVDIPWVLEHLPEVLIWGSLSVVLKLLVCALAVYLCGYSLRASLLTGFCLAEVGEFSFVILLEGYRTQTITSDQYQLFLGVILCTLVMVPALWKPFQSLVSWLAQKPWLQKVDAQRYRTEKSLRTRALKDHVILVGCGPFGQVVLHSLHLQGRSSIVMDLNSQTIRHLQKAGFEAIYGEAGNLKMLESLHVDSANAVVVTIPDLRAAQAIIREARFRKPSLLIFARARYASEIEPLRQAGATHVIYEEMEAATEMARLIERNLKSVFEEAPPVAT